MDATGIGLTILSTVTIINVHSGDVLESASQALFTVRLIKVSIIKMLGPNTEAGLAEAAVVPVLVSGVKTLAPVDLHSIRTITTSSPTTMTTGMSTTIMMTRMTGSVMMRTLGMIIMPEEPVIVSPFHANGSRKKRPFAVYLYR